MWKLGTLDGARLTKFASTVLARSAENPAEGRNNQVPGGPGLYVGNFSISNRTMYDTFVRLDGWTKVSFRLCKLFDAY